MFGFVRDRFSADRVILCLCRREGSMWRYMHTYSCLECFCNICKNLANEHSNNLSVENYKVIKSSLQLVTFRTQLVTNSVSVRSVFPPVVPGSWLIFWHESWCSPCRCVPTPAFNLPLLVHALSCQYFPHKAIVCDFFLFYLGSSYI
jgi:hypothetical protein